jgi:cyclopropane fatty-acyl-phospholipid synthase-like methyltransferase
MCCAEIGNGGGRVASKTIPRISQLVCFDLSEKMLNKAKDSLKEFTNVSFILTDGKSFPVQFSEKFDFVYSFDVFVHLDLHAIWNYFKEIKKILKKGGRVCLHTTNLKAPKGWDRFNKQKFYSVEGHYFITPDIIKLFAEKAGYKIIKTSQVDTSNFYYSRDFLFLMELM